MTESEVNVLIGKDRVNRHAITQVDTLAADTEDFDVITLMHFPFRRALPRRSAFAHKHADGAQPIGCNVAALITALDVLGYRPRFLDAEHCRAIRRPLPTRASAPLRAVPEAINSPTPGMPP